MHVGQHIEAAELQQCEGWQNGTVCLRHDARQMFAKLELAELWVREQIESRQALTALTCGGLSSVRLARPVRLGFCCLRMPNTRSARPTKPQQMSANVSK